jgi:hypothetical protein
MDLPPLKAMAINRERQLIQPTCHHPAKPPLQPMPLTNFLVQADCPWLQIPPFPKT